MKNWDTLRQECPRLYKHGMVFECDYGWFDLLRELSSKIEKHLNDYDQNQKFLEDEEKEIIEMFAVQVKEKYGTLRFYMSLETDEIRELIHEAEALSSQTCEACGAFAKMRGKPWYEVKCDKCYGENK